MRTVPIKTAQTTLPDLIRNVAGGDQIIITENGEPKAKLSLLRLANASNRAREAWKDKSGWHRTLIPRWMISRITYDPEHPSNPEGCQKLAGG